MNRQAHMSIFLQLAGSIGSWVVLAAIDAFTFSISSYNSIHSKNSCQRLPTGHRYLSTVKEVHHCTDYESILAALHTSQQLISRLFLVALLVLSLSLKIRLRIIRCRFVCKGCCSLITILSGSPVVTTNWRSSLTAALGMMFICYFTSPECVYFE